MEFSRRGSLALGIGAACLAILPLRTNAAAKQAIADFTGGAELARGGVTLTAPAIEEDGNNVPIDVSAPGATAFLIVAADNPEPGVATFHFGPLAGTPSVSTRIRLARTQEVIAVARMADGSFASASATIEVTIGGCGA